MATWPGMLRGDVTSSLLTLSRRAGSLLLPARVIGVAHSLTHSLTHSAIYSDGLSVSKYMHYNVFCFCFVVVVVNL